MSHLAHEPPIAHATLRVVIVDDEPLARDCMRLALAHSLQTEIVAECSDGLMAVAAIREHAPDVVFLDVQMPGLDGFGVIERIGAAEMPMVIFVTAYDVHAIRAFDVHALDYVLKPFDDARFLSALDRARERARERQDGELGRRLSAVVHSWNEATGSSIERIAAPPTAIAGKPLLVPDGRSTASVHVADDEAHEWVEEDRGRGDDRQSYIVRFAVRNDGRVRFVAACDVDWIEASRNYIYLHVGETKHRLRSSLSQVADRLDPHTFIRIHRSAVVNVDRIREVQPWFGGDYVAILRNGTKLRVSRLRAGHFLRPMA